MAFFSIAVPTFNRKELLKQTLRSILDQTFTDFEVLVGNDYIKEELSCQSLGIFDSRIRFINHKENLGEAGNMNNLLNEASGKYFTFQFDDDIYATSFLESVSNLISQRKELNCIYTNIGFIYGNKYPLLKDNNKFEHEIISGQNFVCENLERKKNAAGCCGVFKTSILKKIGGIKKISNTPIAIHSEFLLLTNVTRFQKIGYIKNKLMFSRDYNETYSGSTTNYEAYRYAGINLLEEGTKVFNRYCKDVNLQFRFLDALVKTIMKYFIMRLLAVKINNHKVEIMIFLDEIINTINKDYIYRDNKKLLKYFKKIKTRTWLLVKLKAILKWHTPLFLIGLIKKFR